MSHAQVFLTRPEGRNGSVPQRLRALGLRVSELPALAVQPLTPTVLPAPEHYDVVVFVSRYAVQRYLALWAENGGAVPHWPRETVAATVGASSARALSAAGLPAGSIVHPPADASAQDSEALLEILQERGIRMRRVLIVRGTKGRQWLARNLTQRGSQVDFVPVYERVPASWSAQTSSELARALRFPEHCVFLLTSSEGVVALAERLQSAGFLAAWARCAFIVIHERIGATLQSVLASQRVDGVRRLALCTPDDDAIVEAIRAVAGPTAEP